MTESRFNLREDSHPLLKLTQKSKYHWKADLADQAFSQGNFMQRQMIDRNFSGEQESDEGPKLYDPWQIMLKQRERAGVQGQIHVPKDTRTCTSTERKVSLNISHLLQHMIPFQIFLFYCIWFFKILVVLKCLRSTMMVDFPTGSVDKESIWSDMTFIWDHSFPPNRLSNNGLGFCHLNGTHFPTQPICMLKSLWLNLCVKLCCLTFQMQLP